MLNASVCIAIFSPNYAESSRCLEELSFMVKNKKKIIPIFYNVEPSDLRWVVKGKGVYVEAFKKPTYTPQKLEEWKTALYNVSFFYGHELKSKEDKGGLMKSIVESALKHMPSPLEVAQHPVGLDEIVEDFENTFKSSECEQHVDIVGIVGMGGSGKTTLAKELYNRKCFNIDRHSYISEVRDAAAKGTLHELQKKLLRDLLSESFNLPIDNITEGKGILRARFRSLRVLIVLDDVDHVDHIDALLPEKSMFAAGSLIIVTTRELKVLKSTNISCIYKMKPLHTSHAKQLFCWHAFMQSNLVQEFEDLVEEVMEASQGLPLSLKVLGGQLYKEPKDYWVCQLEKISRILPKDIMKRLKLSFDALDREEKEMFLDAACFFLGEEKSLAIEVWNGSGWSGRCGWETLLCKCLVELDQQNHIRMHDHLRDMGRQIAMEQPTLRLFPSADLNIWRQRQAQERMHIRGIMEASTSFGFVSNLMPLFKEYIELKPSICRVKLLVADNLEFSQEYATLSKELRWLRLFNFHRHSCLPSWVSLENLRVLEIYGAPDLEELWLDNMQQPPLQLRILIIELGGEDRGFQKFPRSIGRLRHLKKLCLWQGNTFSKGMCFQNSSTCLQILSKGFCNLQSLEHLELQYLEGLSSLPRRFGDLINLTHLSLEGCRQLKTLPDSFKQLKHLQCLNLQDCINLTFTQHNANIFENITKLEELNLSGCKGLQVLPHHITRQAFLRELDFRGTSLTELPNSIGQLERLEVLRIGSGELESLPDSLGNLSSLTQLDISHCRKVRSLPDSLGRLALLESIDMSNTGVEFLPKAFGHLISLKGLSIWRSPIRELNFGFEESSSLPTLKYIFLGGNRMSTMSIPEDFCPNLQSLSVEDDNFLEEIRTLPRTVKTINLTDCERLKDIACIGRLGNLERLTIEECPELAELPSFAEFASIKEIEIIGCPISGKMEGLEQVTSLETLNVHTRWKVPGITSLEHAQRLRTLKLKADNTGAVEGCIKTLQKWPGEVIIWCRASSGGVESVVKAFTSSNLMVVEACADGDEEDDGDEEADEDDVDDEDDEACAEGDDGADETDRNDEDDGDEEADEDGCRKPYLSVIGDSYSGWRQWRLEGPRNCLSHEATIVCFVFNGLSDYASCCNINLGEGRWVCIRAISHGRESGRLMGLDSW